MGQVDIDIVEVQIQNSLIEMKLSHCEALYHSLLRQQHEFQAQFSDLNRELNQSRVGVEEDEEEWRTAMQMVAERDGAISQLESDMNRLDEQVRFTTHPHANPQFQPSASP
jgi:chromosome segregation ATPase